MGIFDDITFGIEPEFQTNAGMVNARLHMNGYASHEEMHAYHCRCSGCDAMRETPAWTCQRDSSVNGEFISRVFYGLSDGGEALEALEEAAVACDAEPALNAGCHVHVERPLFRAEAFRLFVALEPTLEIISAGAFGRQRNANYSLRAEYIGDGVIARFWNNLDTWDELLTEHRDADRHSNLNVNTSTGATWEYRLWNSTRVAWRMRLYVMASIALAHHTSFQERLWSHFRHMHYQDMPADEFLALARQEDFEDDGEFVRLLERQLQFQTNRSGPVAPRFTDGPIIHRGETPCTAYMESDFLHRVYEGETYVLVPIEFIRSTGGLTILQEV